MAHARLPLPDRGDPELAPLVARIIDERGELLTIYEQLLHAPPVAAGWLRLLTAIRQQSILPARLRELVIMRVASLNRAPYEAEQHRPIALAAGLSEAQLDALDDWERSGRFDDLERSALAYTDVMTRSVAVPDAVFRAIRSELDDRRLVELTATIAAYNMVSRFLEALEIRT